MMEEGFTFWSDRLQIIALQNKSQFDKLCDKKEGKVVMKEITMDSLFNNGEVILWKKGYGYDLKLFNKTRKLAKELDLDIILMPDTDMENGFPMAFTNSERTVFLILAPRGFDGNDKVYSFASNWGTDSKENDKLKTENSELKFRLEKLKDIINQSGKEEKI
jgi:hypothetical protein